MIRQFACLLFASLSALNVLGFNIFSESEEIPEQGSVPRYRIVHGAESFVLHPPRGWTVQRDDGRKELSFNSDKLQSSLSIRFVTNAPAANARTIKAQVQERWPHAAHEEPTVCISLDQTGPALEFSYASAGSASFRTRVAALNYGSCVVELTLTAPEQTFAKAHHGWTAIINSLARTPQKTASAAIPPLQN